MCRMKTKWLLLVLGIVLNGCTISYKFNGSSIDYTTTSTISISTFPNLAPLVYGPLSQMLTEGLKDMYIRQTRLQMVSDNGDLDLEGEITGYSEAPMAIMEDAYSSKTKLTMTVKVRFSNRNKSEDDFEQSFSAFREYDSNVNLSSIESELCTDLVKEITEQIYNATVAKW
ncbi:MAG: LPS assembly lipoprotein LptE [Tannerellaceae bacterium]|nr:LPS assembly lipoprotein LptE [Tannerellaceae bacterium]